MDEHAWWQYGVVYQIYPRSFQDSDDDGVGDLNGIIARLDYLKDLGVDAIWISPIFPSPMADFGYDVSDYTDIEPIFGTLADFDRLVAATHARGLKLILDYVPNHTSDRHPWFVESKSSRTSPKRDWYIWRDAKPDGSPPTNWLSEFGGPAWTFDEATGQFYYHAYLREQPDLNWRNPEVRAAMLDVLRFWFDRGVDGFRIDTIHHLIEDAEMRDNPPNPRWTPAVAPSKRLLRTYTIDQPEVHDAIVEMRAVADEYPGERVMIGEAYLPFDRLMAYYGVDGKGFQLPFNFHLLTTPWTARAIAGLVETYEAALPTEGWPNWVLGNHDRKRLASRLGQKNVRNAAMLILTLRGTPTLYQGDEIGMENVAIPPEFVQDPWEKNEPGLGLGRDPVRTPMQWEPGQGAGFTSATPWLPFSSDYSDRNVAVQSEDPRSVLTLYKRLLTLRRSTSALSVGSYRTVEIVDEALIFERSDGDERVLVAINFGEWPAEIGHLTGAGRLLLSTELDVEGAMIETLRPYEGVVLDVGSAG